MPYVTQKEKDMLNPFISGLFKRCEHKKGRINYCCTKLIHLWAIKQMEKIKSLTKKYDILNDAYGIICSAAAEFYSAVVVPYEKLKRKENGPVSQLDKFADGALPTGKYKCDKCERLFEIPGRTEISGRYISCCPYCGSKRYMEY